MNKTNNNDMDNRKMGQNSNVGGDRDISGGSQRSMSDKNAGIAKDSPDDAEGDTELDSDLDVTARGAESDQYGSEGSTGSDLTSPGQGGKQRGESEGTDQGKRKSA